MITRVHKKKQTAKKEHLWSRKTKGAASAGGESKMCEGQRQCEGRKLRILGKKKGTNVKDDI